MKTVPSVPHTPVLLQPVLDGLDLKSNGLYIDGTVGAGGHASAILDTADGSRLLGLDRDPRSLEIARNNLVRFGDRVILLHANYNTMESVAPANGFTTVDGILLDLGISS